MQLSTLAYATVKKTYKKGKVAKTRQKLVHGNTKDLNAALEASSSSTKINTAFIERQNGTDRIHNARKVRKIYRFSKDLLVHMAVSWWVMFCYNFHFAHRGLRLSLPDGTFIHRTPAVAAGLTTAPLSVSTIVTTQVVGFVPTPAPSIADFESKHMRQEHRLTHAHGPAP